MDLSIIAVRRDGTHSTTSTLNGTVRASDLHAKISDYLELIAEWSVGTSEGNQPLRFVIVYGAFAPISFTVDQAAQGRDAIEELVQLAISKERLS